MIRRPGHLAIGPPATDERQPQTGLDLDLDLDLDLAARNVAREGGDRRLFHAALGAGLRAGGTDGADVVGLAGMAAWRAGALAYRDAALAHLEELVRDAPERAAAVLALAPDELETFLLRQRTDRFWWPGRAAARGYVCAVGGFAGIGGVFVAPPQAGHPLPAPGAFAIHAGGWWRLDADVWGSRLVPLDDEPDASPRAASFGDPSSATASIVCLADSYLAWVHVREAA